MALKVKKKFSVARPARPHHTLPQRTYKREQRRQSMRRLMTSMLILTLLAVAAGIGYTWYTGKHQLAADATPPPTPLRPVLKPPKTASNAPVGLATQMVTSPVKAGDNASITIRTNPDADCSISVLYNNIPARDSGLITKPADEFGIASWAWTVAPGTPKGTWPVQVTCKNKKYSAVVRADLVVE